MEVGHRLIAMVDMRQGGELLARIKGVRRKYAQEIGFLPPVIHIRDNLELGPNQYVISLKGAEVGRGEAYPGRWLAINPGKVSGKLPGVATTEPAFGLAATWIEPETREQAQVYGYTVVDTPTVITTHLNHLMTRHADQLLGRSEVSKLLEKLGPQDGGLVEEVVPALISQGTLQRILHNLLDEEVSIRDMRTILEALAEHAPHSKDPNDLTAMVRVALGRAITQYWFGAERVLRVIGLEAQLEQVLMQALSSGNALEPGLADTLMQHAENAVAAQDANGEPSVLVVGHALRPLVGRFLRRRFKSLAVLSQAEIPDDRELRVTQMIGGRAA